MSRDPRIKVCNLDPGENPGEKGMAQWMKQMTFTLAMVFPINVILFARKTFASTSTMNPIQLPRVIRDMEANSVEKRVDSWLRNHGYLLAEVQARPLHT